MAKPTLNVVAHESLSVLRAAVRKTSDAAWKQRLKAVLKAREGKKRKEIAEELLASERSVGAWIGAYNDGGVGELKTKPSGRKHGPQRWQNLIFDDLAREIDKGGYWSVPKMQEWLANHHAVTIPEQTVWYRMDQLNYSYKSARPHPVQGNKAKQDAFKKGASLRSWSR